MERTLRSSKEARVRPIVEGWRFRPPLGLGNDELASRVRTEADEEEVRATVEGVEANNGKRT